MPDEHTAGGLRGLARALTGREAREKVEALERLVRKLSDLQREQFTTLNARIAELAALIAQQPGAKDLREVLDAIRALGGQIDRSIDDRLAHSDASGRQLLDAKRLHKELDRIAAGDGPVVMGPWTGEVGFELLYWVPFVNWLREQWKLRPERLVVLSRGGVESWYGLPRAQYADALSFYSPDEFRAGVDPERPKQRRTTAFDQRLFDAVAQSRGLPAIDTIHPELMYRMFMPYWRDEASFSRVEQFTRYERLDAPVDDMPAGLPPEYVAVRFYFSQCFPPDAENRAFVQAVVASLAARIPVVLLNPGVQVDDHVDVVPAVRDRVHTIAGAIPPERNLAVQSAVISRARAFVGTYGGYSYLAPFYGVPSLAFYSQRTFRLHHLHAAQRVFDRLGGATVLPLDVAHAPLAQLALASVAPAGS
jgi:hypothetical protein